MQARPYQQEAVQSIYTYFAEATGNPVVAMPTGTGKSIVIAEFLKGVFRYYPRQKVLVLTHVKELIEQNYAKLIAMWSNAPAGIYSAGLGLRQSSFPITFGGIGSVAKKAHLFGYIDLVIIDEAHLVSPNEETMYQAFLNALKVANPALKVIGLTATPWRLGQGKITTDGIFTDICFDITGLQAFNRLVEEGYLSPLITKQTGTILDTSGVHMRGGEFNASELQLAVDRDEVTYAALKEVLELGADRNHWLVFASGVEHAVHVGAMLESLGIPTAVVHSKMTTQQRDEAIAGFKAGKYRAAVNNNVLTTGFDFPGIDLIVGLRPTASPVLWVQMLGRGTRPLYAPGFDLLDMQGRLQAIQAGPKQNCLVLDFANNTRRLGPINDPVIPRKKGEKGGEAPVKLCPLCNTWNHASVRVCCACGAEFTFQLKIQNHAGTDEVMKTDLPVVEMFKVDHIVYSKHSKLGKPDMMKASYYCGLRLFEDFVCVEHEGFAQRKAREWWRGRSAFPVPASVVNALALADSLAPVTHLRVWTNKKYPEILAYCMDGSAFDTKEADDQQVPEVQVRTVTPAPAMVQLLGNDCMDDDIPF